MTDFKKSLMALALMTAVKAVPPEIEITRRHTPTCYQPSRGKSGVAAAKRAAKNGDNRDLSTLCRKAV